MFTSPFVPGLRGASVDEVVRAGVELLAERPRTRAELSALLAPRWPDADPLALAYAVTYHAPLVQVPPRGLWRESGQATWAHAERWLEAEVDPQPSVESVVLRYLAAFGPATVADIRTWSGIAGLREVVARLRPELRTFRDERGRELVDLPDGPLPDPDTPAPPRFLPEYDNVTLSHDDRSRILAGDAPAQPLPPGGTIGTLLIDGFARGTWKVAEQAGGPTLTIDRLRRLPDDPPNALEEVHAEGEELLRFLAPDAAERRVVIAQPPKSCV
jgi:hypothetical protein